MTFLFPIFFWTLLGLGPLAAIYFLKVRPRRKPITTFFLWDAVLEQKRATRLWQRLRDILSLLLLMLAFVDIVLAMTSPRTTTQDKRGLLILIDHSASMNTRDSGGTRLDQAKRVARSLIRGLDPEQEAAVATMAAQLTFQCHLTRQPRECLEAIDCIEPTQVPFHVDLLDQILTQVDPNTIRVMLLSDGCPWQGGGPKGVELYKIGHEAKNVGIVACDLQRRPGSDQLDLWLQLASSGTEEQSVDLWLRHGPDMEKMITTTVSPGLNPPQVWPVAGTEAGSWTLILNQDDALTDDNTAYLVVHPHHPIRVAIQADQSYYPTQSVRAFAQSSGDLAWVESQPDVTLAVGQTATVERQIIFAPQGDRPWWLRLGQSLEDVMPRLLIEDHPVLRHCDLQDVPFVGARALEAPAGAVILAENRDHVPLLYTVRQGTQRAVVFNMDPAAAQFYFSAWFPVSVYNSARVLMGREETYDATTPTDHRIVSPSTWDTNSLDVRGPGPEQITHWDIRTRGLGPLSRIGFYQWQQPDQTTDVGVSLLSDADSRVNRPDVLDTHQPIARGWPLSVYCALLALVVLALECGLYHRRKVG